MPRISSKKRKWNGNGFQPASKKQETNTSASKVKLGNRLQEYDEYLSDNSAFNEIIDVSLLSDVLKQSVVCKKCKSEGISVKFVKQIQGLATELSIFCESCQSSIIFLNTKYSQKLVNARNTKTYHVNTRLTYAMRSIGRGKTAAKTFCGLMNLPAPTHRFNETCTGLSAAIENVAKLSMSDAADEAKHLNNESKNIPIALDGTWQRRGRRSLNGVVVATSMDTGKVLDSQILTRYCKCANKCAHTEKCKANHFGNSGSMEVAGAINIFQRSESLHGLHYTKLLGDGDSRAYKAIVEINPYEEEIEKLECVGHVEKRMGTRLRNLKQKMKGTKLPDNKVLGGRGRLTDAAIDSLQLYYGLAIRNNTDSLKSMKKAVWATYFHKASTDTSPQHGLCPNDKETWCSYNKALLTGASYKHMNNLPPDVLNTIKDIYRDLANPKLLAKCLHGKTQNCNESFNSVLWSLIPKTVFVQIETLKMGVYEATSSYNQGNIGKCKVLSMLGIPPGFYTCRAMMSADQARIRKAEYDILQKTKEARLKKRHQKCMLEDSLADDPADPSYGAGMH